VGGLAVKDGTDELASGHYCFHPVKEADKFLMAMARHTLLDHGTVEDFERREQRRRVVPDIIVVIVPARPFFIGSPAECDQELEFATSGRPRARGCGLGVEIKSEGWRSLAATAGSLPGRSNAWPRRAP
jgi:hypothetical protein